MVNFNIVHDFPLSGLPLGCSPASSQSECNAMRVWVPLTDRRWDKGIFQQFLHVCCFVF